MLGPQSNLRVLNPSATHRRLLLPKEASLLFAEARCQFGLVCLMCESGIGKPPRGSSQQVSRPTLLGDRTCKNRRRTEGRTCKKNKGRALKKSQSRCNLLTTGPCAPGSRIMTLGREPAACKVQGLGGMRIKIEELQFITSHVTA